MQFIFALMTLDNCKYVWQNRYDVCIVYCEIHSSEILSGVTIAIDKSGICQSRILITIDNIGHWYDTYTLFTSVEKRLVDHQNSTTLILENLLILEKVNEKNINKNA